MKRILWLSGSLWAGLILGIAAALWYGGAVPGGPQRGKTVNVGGWQSDWAAGLETANPYTKARLARHDVFALPKEEMTVFVKAVDDFGAPLSEACRYRVSGRALPAAWWSITLYNENRALPLNGDKALSFTAGDAAGEKDWSFLIAAQRPSAGSGDDDGTSAGASDDEAAGSWVSSRAAGAFTLYLRLFTPSSALLEHPKRVLRTPTIERLSCAEPPQ